MKKKVKSIEEKRRNEIIHTESIHREHQEILNYYEKNKNYTLTYLISMIPIACNALRNDSGFNFVLPNSS